MAVVWLRMLKVLGNINEIKDPLGHAEAMAALNEIWNGLNKVSGCVWWEETGPEDACVVCVADSRQQWHLHV